MRVARVRSDHQRHRWGDVSCRGKVTSACRELPSTALVGGCESVGRSGWLPCLFSCLCACTLGCGSQLWCVTPTPSQLLAAAWPSPGASYPIHRLHSTLLSLHTALLGLHTALLFPPSSGCAAAEFSLAEPHAALGTKLSVSLPAGLKAGDSTRVGLHFAASPQASAVQWLPPEQTAGKQHPYLFTQCQAIHARWVGGWVEVAGAVGSRGQRLAGWHVWVGMEHLVVLPCDGCRPPAAHGRVHFTAPVTHHTNRPAHLAADPSCPAKTLLVPSSPTQRRCGFRQS